MFAANQGSRASTAVANKLAMSTPSRHILVVDDDPEIRFILRKGLERDGFTVTEASNKSTMLKCLDGEPIEPITLDLALEADDGLELAREIRAKRNIPIIMITGRGTPTDRVMGLERGADDYIAKPFHIREVQMRIRNVFDRYRLPLADADATSPDEEGRRVAFEHGILDTVKREVKKIDGSQVDLTDAEFRLLALLVRHPGRVLSRDEICRALYARDWSPTDRTIDVLIAKLRRKLEPLAEAPMLIKSVRGVGYVFAGEVVAERANSGLQHFAHGACEFR